VLKSRLKIIGFGMLSHNESMVWDEGLVEGKEFQLVDDETRNVWEPKDNERGNWLHLIRQSICCRWLCNIYLRRQTRPQQIIIEQIASPVKPTASTAATATYISLYDYWIPVRHNSKIAVYFRQY